MNVNTALNAYSQHSLSIDIKTSSGDNISLDFNNEKSLNYEKNEKGTSFSFTSLESYSFSYEGNGIDAQDRKEIAAYMEIAQPFIDKFVAGLNDGSSLITPINKITNNIAQIFNPIKEKGDGDLLAFSKNSLVNQMDKALEKEINPIEQSQKVLAHAERFLDQLMKDLDKTKEFLYL